MPKFYFINSIEFSTPEKSLWKNQIRRNLNEKYVEK
jgi:hypothetical protein